MKVYLAGPITSLSWEECTAWRNRIIAELKPLGLECYSPLRAKNYLSHFDNIGDRHPELSVLSSARGIYIRDKWDATRCDVLFVNFLGATKVSIGTILEIAWADAYDKPIIIVMEENNIHRHSMIMECAGYIVPTLEEGIHVIKALLIQE